MRHLLAAALLLATPTLGSAVPLFTETFEADLSAWTGKGGGAHNGEIVLDPLGGVSHVLHFTARNSGGDIFTIAQFAPGPGFVLEFDYLGLGSTGDSGGFVAWANTLIPAVELGGDHYWLAGTQDSYGGLLVALPDTGIWVHVVIEFPGSFPAANPDLPFHLTFEDFVGSDAIIGNAYFDNIELHTVQSVPEPSTLLLVSGGLAAAIALRRRRR